MAAIFSISPTESGAIELKSIISDQEACVDLLLANKNTGQEQGVRVNLETGTIEQLVRVEAPVITINPAVTTTSTIEAAAGILNKQPEQVATMFNISANEVGNIEVKSIISDQTSDVKLLLADRRTGAEQGVRVNLGTGTIEQLVRVDQVMLHGTVSLDALAAALSNHPQITSREQLASAIGYSNQASTQNAVNQLGEVLSANGILTSSSIPPVLFVKMGPEWDGNGRADSGFILAGYSTPYIENGALRDEIAVLVAHEAKHMEDGYTTMSPLAREASAQRTSYQTAVLVAGSDSTLTIRERNAMIGFDALVNNSAQVASVFGLAPGQFSQISYVGIRNGSPEDPYIDIGVTDNQQQIKTFRIDLSTGTFAVI